MLRKFDIAVIGGGPAGIMAALTAKNKENKKSICLIEASERICKKLRITGGGRCNFTNNKDISCFFDNIVNNEKFMYSSLYTFTNEDTKKFIKSIGLDYIVEKENDDKVYLKSGNALDLIDRLEYELKKADIEIFLNSKVKNIKIEEGTKSVYTESELFQCDKLIIATGGKSYPQTGSDGEMLKIVKKLGYNIVSPVSALSPIEIKEKWINNIPGISICDVDIQIYNGKHKKARPIKIIRGDIIFTHKGIGGPAALKASSYINRELENAYISIDFLASTDTEELYEIAKSYPKKSVLNNIRGILPNNFVKCILEEAQRQSERNFDFINENSSNMSKKDYEVLATLIKSCKLNPKKLCSIDKATVTSGGVSVSEIDSSTMESKKHKGVFFAGEIIDVDALTGGYNLQIAFSTGYISGIST